MHSFSRRTVQFALLIAIALLTTALPAVAQQQQDNEWTVQSQHWYIFEIAGSRAGWMRDTTETNGTHYRTGTNMKMRIGRADVASDVQITTSFIETADGKPVSMSTRQKMSSQVVESSYVFAEDHIELTTKEGARTTTRELPSPQGDWLTPHALQQFLAQRHEAKPEQFTYRTIDPSQGIEPVSVTTRFVREDSFDLGDRTIPVTVWTSRSNALPVDATEMFSTDNVLVYWEAEMGMGKMIMRLVTREEALAEHDGAPPELLVSAFAHSNKPIRDHMRTTQLRYRLIAEDGNLPELPTAGAQRITAYDGKSATLIVDIDDNVPAPKGDAGDAQYTSSSSMIDSDDPLVRKLAVRALRDLDDDADDMTRADRLRAFVYKHISDKGLETAFASASETARTRTGDCSEHSVLLAAVLRAAGIPARIATGLLYVTEANGQGIFGWHMWTQALIDGRWVDFDATLPVRSTAGHILTSTSSFADGSSNSDLNSLFVLMGNLEIEILDTAPKATTTEQ